MRVAVPHQRGENVELPRFEVMVREDGIQSRADDSLEAGESPDDRHAGHIHIGALSMPLLEDLVDLVWFDLILVRLISRHGEIMS